MKKSQRDAVFYVPDFNPVLVGRNVFYDPQTDQKYGLPEVNYCMARSEALQELHKRMRLQKGDSRHLLQTVRFEL